MSLQVHLNRRLELEEVSRQPDGAGGHTESWAVLGALWADVRAGSGRESQGLAALVSLVPYRIIVRAAPVGAASRPRPDQRFREGTRIFRIVAVAEYDAAGMYLECFTKEEVPS